MTSGISRPALSRWVERGIISPEQAEAIWRFETGQTASQTAIASSAVSPAEPPSPSRASTHTRPIPLVAEVLGYVGGSLAVGALLALTAQFWFDLGTLGQLALSGVVAVVCLAGGWSLSLLSAPQGRRLGSFLLFLGAAVVGLFWGLAAHAWGIDVEELLVTGAGAALLCGLVVWWRRRTSLQLVGVALALAAFVPGAAIAWLSGSDTTRRFVGFSYLTLGALWCALGERGWLKPIPTAWVMGSLALLVGPQVLAMGLEGGRGSDAYLLLGGAVSLALLGAALLVGRGAPLAFGAFGIVVFTPQYLYRSFEDSMGAPITLLIAGVLLVGMSFVVIALRPRLHSRVHQ